MPHTLSLFFWVVGYYTRLLAQPLLLASVLQNSNHSGRTSSLGFTTPYYSHLVLGNLPRGAGRNITNTLKSTKKATTSTAE